MQAITTQHNLKRKSLSQSCFAALRSKDATLFLHSGHEAPLMVRVWNQSPEATKVFTQNLTMSQGNPLKECVEE